LVVIMELGEVRMRIVRYADVADQRWRNGGGTTRELHRDEHWRLSVATISAAGDFSAFPGLDRTFVVAHGDLSLSVATSVHHLGPGDLLRFGGEEMVTAEPRGRVLAVNVMVTRPARATVRVGGWAGGSAVALVDLATLDAYLDVRPGDQVEGLVVVVEEIS
jgi:environmental stress-induced protein Ves